jgi:hypothetical protein
MSWKDKNYSKKIKVSQSTIDDLNRGGNFKSNFNRLKSSLSPEQREAMNRYYGKDRVDAAYAKYSSQGKAKRDAAAPKKNFMKGNPETVSKDRFVSANPSAKPQADARSNFNKANPDVVNASKNAAKKRAIERVDRATRTATNGPRRPMR